MQAAPAEHFPNRLGTGRGVWKRARRGLPKSASRGAVSPLNPTREAVLLVVGDKAGLSERWFFRALIRKADERFDWHLARLVDEGGCNDRES